MTIVFSPRVLRSIRKFSFGVHRFHQEETLIDCKYLLIRRLSARLSPNNCNVGTIGHLHHGKTTLTSAITKYAAKQGNCKYSPVEDINNSAVEKASGMSIHLHHVEYNTNKRRYIHLDCPGHKNYFRNTVAGVSQMNAAIVVVAAAEGPQEQTLQHLLLAKHTGVKNIIVFLNKADLANEEILDTAELEIKEMLTSFGYNNSPVIVGSAMLALNDDLSDYGETSIRKLLNTLDEYDEISDRDLTSPLYMTTDYAFTTNNKTVVTGTVRRGKIRKNDEVVILGYGFKHKAVVGNLEIFHDSVDEVVAGDHCGVLLEGDDLHRLKRGVAVCAENSVKLNNYFEAELYLLTKNEANADVRPITSGFIANIFSDTWMIRCRVELPIDVEPLMPGHRSKATLILNQKMPLLLGQTFTLGLAETNIVATGCITKIKTIIPNVNSRGLKKLVLVH